MNKLDRFCEAIMQYEGWKPGSRSFRNSNPGNLRDSPFKLGMDGGMCTFKTFADGWNALVFDVKCKATGRTRTSLSGDSTMRDFFDIYAPKIDNNEPNKYCLYVCDRVGVSPDDKLKSLMED